MRRGTASPHIFTEDFCMEIDKRLIVLLERSADEIKKTVIGKDDIIIKILMTA